LQEGIPESPRSSHLADAVIIAVLSIPQHCHAALPKPLAQSSI